MINEGETSCENAVSANGPFNCHHRRRRCSQAACSE